MRKKIVFISKYYPPSVGAASSRIWHFAKNLAEWGWDVHVLTEFPNYPTGIIPQEFKGKWKKKSVVDGVTVHHLYCYSSQKKSLLKRLMNELSFLFSSTLYIKNFKEFDFMFYSSPPFLLALFSLVQRRFCKLPQNILDIRDLYPETAIELGVIKNKVLIHLVEWFERKLYLSSDLVLTVSPGLVDKIAKKTNTNVKLLTNGADTDVFIPLKNMTKGALRKKLNWNSDEFIVLYTGTHGLMEKIETLLDAAFNLKEYDKIRFVLVGGGYRKPALVEYKNELKLKNVDFYDNSYSNALTYMMNAADLGVVLKKDYPLCRNHLPVKMFEYASCGLPIVASIHGVAADLVGTENIGWVVPPENSELLSRLILKIYKNRDVLDEKKDGRRIVEMKYSRKKTAGILLGYLENLNV